LAQPLISIDPCKLPALDINLVIMAGDTSIKPLEKMPAESALHLSRVLPKVFGLAFDDVQVFSDPPPSFRDDSELIDEKLIRDRS